MKNSKCLVCRGKVKLLFASLFDDRYGSPGKYSIYRCSKCGFMRLFPLIPQKEMADFYAKYYPTSNAKADEIKKKLRIKSKFINWLNGNDNQSHLYIKKYSKVLDVGCGDCSSLMEIKKLGGIPSGLDPNPYSKKISKNLGLNVRQGFIYDNLFEKEKFDFVTASQVIEHEQDPILFLETSKKLLNNNGKIILSFPNADSVYRKIFGKKWINWHVPYHINFFNKKSFTILSKETNLNIIKLKTISPNIWTILQIRSLFTFPQEGVKNPLWSVTNKTIRFKYKSVNLFNYIFKIMQLCINVIIILFNRLIDLIGWGDSFLVVLEKNYEN